jgi:hypothetical protein
VRKYGATIAVVLAFGLLSVTACRSQSQAQSEYALLERVHDERTGFWAVSVSVKTPLPVAELEYITCQVIKQEIDDNRVAFTVYIYADLAEADYRPGFGGLASLDDFRAQHLLSFYRWNHDLPDSLGIGLVMGDDNRRHDPAEYHEFDHVVSC